MTTADMGIAENVTPEQLRAEATRRELRDRAKWVADRRAARNNVVDALLALDRADVRAANATAALRAALTMLAREDDSDQQREPTNGEISMAGRSGWWDEIRRRVPRVDRHPMLASDRSPTW